MKKIVLAVFALIILIYLFLGPIPIPINLGRIDFTAYWSTAYLLARSENFSDSNTLLTVEQTWAMWDGDFPIKAWNPPWLLPLLLPYTLVPFQRAVWLWFNSNIILVFTASVMAWISSANKESVSKRAWLAPLISFVFAPLLTGLYMGQVNTLVYFGLAAMLYFADRNRLLLSGSALTLTIVKPHLVYVTIPILLLSAVYKKEWRFVAGFLGTLLGLTAVTFALRPSFIGEYIASSTSNNLLSWQTPTLGGILNFLFGWEEAVLMSLLVLPLSIIWWWTQKDRLLLTELTHITVFISIITAPFGWGYDAIILMIPILQIIVWVFEGHYSRTMNILLIGSLVLIDVSAIYQRTRMNNEVFAFWLPIILAFLYLLARRQKGLFSQLNVLNELERLRD
ncbi:MAG: DUF2029 domain-containing protein [Chloroflexi bacterium]|nr:DUF2029 domain-containing protein [Chloroflexota bacterium]